MSETLKKFTVRVQRNQIAEADIEVEATDYNDAEEKAMETAENDESIYWDEVDYNYDILDVEGEEDGE